MEIPADLANITHELNHWGLAINQRTEFHKSITRLSGIRLETLRLSPKSRCSYLKGGVLKKG